MFHSELEKERPGLQRSLSDSSVANSVAASPYWGVPSPDHKPEGFSPFVAFCFTINYILGTGFLTVPWAFVQGGLVLSTVVLVTTGLLSDMAKNYILETMARAEAMLDSRMRWIKKNPGDEEKQQLVYSPVIIKAEKSALLHSVMAVDYESMEGQPTGTITYKNNMTLPVTPGSSQPGTPDGKKIVGRQLIKRPKKVKYVVKERKFEVNSLCRIFLGKGTLRVYTAFICLYIYCTLWAYTSVFASAMARAAPLFASGDEDVNYFIYALIFASVVVPMSCMEMDEQVIVQVTMTGARFLMLFLMLGTSALCAQEERSGQSQPVAEAPMFRASGIHKMVPIMVFAHIYHHSIPGLSHPVADKKQLSGIFQSTTVFSTVAYTFIGLILGSAFGESIEESSNLNWNGFTGGVGAGGTWWAKAISWYVMLFPALDVLSAFPLNAMTLGNNMLGAAYGRKIHEVENDRWIRTQFRLLAGIPPIIMGVLERKLGTITDYAGTTGFIIGFSFPAILALKSKAVAKRKHYLVHTFYTSYASFDPISWAVFWFGIIMVVFVMYGLIKGGD